MDTDFRGPPQDYVGYGPRIPSVTWPNDAYVALNFVINYEEGAEYTWSEDNGRGELLGEFPSSVPRGQRDLRTESIFEYGSRAGIWRLLRLFDRYGVKVTVFASAMALERNPQVGTWIASSGHEPCGHGWRWSEHWHFDRAEEKRRILAAVDAIERICGQRPRGWNCRNSATVHTRELLVEVGGFVYDSDAYNDDLPYFVSVSGQRHLVIPYSMTYNDIRYAQTPGYSSPRDFYESCRLGLDYLLMEGAERPSMMSIGLHPRWAGQAARTAALRDFVEYALGRKRVWVTRRIDIAEHWIANSALGDAP